MDNGKWPRNCKLSFYLTKNPNYVPIVGFRSFVIFCYQSDFYLARIFLSMKSVFCRRYSFLTYSYAIPGIGNARFHFAYTRVEGLIFAYILKMNDPLNILPALSVSVWTSRLFIFFHFFELMMLFIIVGLCLLLQMIRDELWHSYVTMHAVLVQLRLTMGVLVGGHNICPGGDFNTPTSGWQSIELAIMEQTLIADWSEIGLCFEGAAAASVRSVADV